MINNIYNHHPDCGLKNISMDFASCGCFGVWDKFKELNVEVDKQGHKAMAAETKLKLEGNLVAALQAKVKELEKEVGDKNSLIFDTISTLKLLHDDCSEHCTDEDILSLSRSIFDRFKKLLTQKDND